MKSQNKKQPRNRVLVVGPCAAESRGQILAAIEQAKKRHIDFMRMCLWKPRTKPGFEGLGEKGIDLFIEAAKAGVNPGTEVLIPQHAELIMNRVLGEVPKTKILLWIGARNQNHYIQREISRVAAMDPRVYLMIKNQPWHDEKHWMGIVDHVVAGGISLDHIMLCHRGFHPHGLPKPNNFRNVPDFEMAMRVKETTGLPMIFDPSHVGGTVANVFKAVELATQYPFDGLMIEVHPNPGAAMTDAKQQLTYKDLDRLLG